MNYRVDWSPTAHDRLERLWVAAENQAAVLRAANAIDVYLAEDPYRHDAHRIGDENSFIVEPLAVDYEIIEAHRRVVIVAVWMIRFLENAE
ncbi:MAG: hypothetical protein L0211_15730 [Planctomycetaceae bacterium]|nr:hypothetical protein [Planctomycetaceae bacterium]